MGGRSSSFRTKKSGVALPKVMDEEEYLSKYGVDSPMSGIMADKFYNLTNHEKKTLGKITREAQNKYYPEREKREKEYADLVRSGKVRPRTQAERMFISANGLPDRPHTQAARRMLTKRGIDWKTGKRIKGFKGHGYPEIDPKTGIEKRR